MTMDEIVHAHPLQNGAGVTPCCGRYLRELPHTDMFTADPVLVTCPERRHQYVIGTAREDIPAGAPVVLEITEHGRSLVSIRH